MTDAFTDLDPVTLPPESTLTEAMERMTATNIGIVLVTDAERHLLGVVVDGDIRRALLRNPDLDQPLSSIMTANPRTAPFAADDESLAALAEGAKSPWLPLVDDQNCVRGLVNLLTYRQQRTRLPNAAVLMAGGRGTRLMPLTAEMPKPMMSIGGRPILETLIRQLAGHGIDRFYLSVNYLAEKIEAHFGDGASLGVEIRYLHEDSPLGTAGGIAPLCDIEEAPLLVMNGDVLSRVSPRSLFAFHAEEGVMATVAVREFAVEIPYGVVEIEDRRLSGFLEKPVHTVYINAGIYVLDPKGLAHIPPNEKFDMPDLLNRINADPDGGVACFPVPEYWADIGHKQDLQRAEQDFHHHFPEGDNLVPGSGIE
jgi:dTDP-glucose pyrophosphorylase